ncbi:arginine--tRNA ligase [Actinomadura bangladeshensis]|uniref:Arginine--tRNA ligase n=1 Tax=Actinomadura bangladeshensis TaxID=453573 RepID=A0A4R4PE54_9ACTN|nr:arginine--tRNA ligase [Actinomadura bangladeshensis]TDC19737.1 arginine--tRNA ligase [Actinomadura bangladeshensis]
MLPDLGAELERRIVDAVHAALDVEITPEQAVIRPSAPGRAADYQCNAAMPLAKRLGRPSREIADAIAAHLDTTGLIADVAGPGFVNLTFTEEFLAAHLAALAADDRLGVPEQAPLRVVIDYSSPNMAKEMHVGHLRSTIIGDALVRLHEELGHEVIRQNHLGDWGTPFGKLVEHLVDEGLTSGELSIGDLNEFYVQASRKFDADPDFAERARKRVVALQAGDPATLDLWRRLLEESKRHMEAVYALLGVRLTPADYMGESACNDVLGSTCDELVAKGLAMPSEGALCVFPRGFTGREGAPVPLIIRKRDGGYNYDTTDLATIRYRSQDLKGDLLLYVVGAPQALHFKMIFAAAREAEWLAPTSTATHVAFGSVLGSDGKVLGSRKGAGLKLADLLQEAVTRAAAIVADRSELSADEQAEIARAVGIGAVKYADLSTAREKDYVFDWDRMMSMDGNTATYLQYAHARIRSLIRKAADSGAGDGSANLLLAEPAERALALKLSQYPAAVTAAARFAEPHRLCTHLFETATAFSTFYETCPVLTAGDAVRASRLALSTHTARVIRHGLALLGIQAPERL